MTSSQRSRSMIFVVRLEASRGSGLFCQLVAPGFEDVEGDTTLPLNKLVKLFDDMEEGWRWATESAENVRKQAVTMLDQLSMLPMFVSRFISGEEISFYYS